MAHGGAAPFAHQASHSFLAPQLFPVPQLVYRCAVYQNEQWIVQSPSHDPTAGTLVCRLTPQMAAQYFPGGAPAAIIAQPNPSLPSSFTPSSFGYLGQPSQPLANRGYIQPPAPNTLPQAALFAPGESSQASSQPTVKTEPSSQTSPSTGEPTLKRTSSSTSSTTSKVPGSASKVPDSASKLTSSQREEIRYKREQAKLIKA